MAHSVRMLQSTHRTLKGTKAVESSRPRQGVTTQHRVHCRANSNALRSVRVVKAPGQHFTGPEASLPSTDGPGLTRSKGQAASKEEDVLRQRRRRGVPHGFTRGSGLG